MSAPLQSGDQATVIGGLGRHQSPNLGLIVTVMSCQGEHSRHGRMWRCQAPAIQQLTDTGGYVTTGWGDFAQAWLKKIEPPKINDSIRNENEVTA